MRTKFFVGLGVVILAVIVWFLFATRAGARVGIVDIYTGTSVIRFNNQERPARSGEPVYEREEIVVPVGSRMGILFADGSVVRIDGGTTVVIRDLLTEHDALIRGHVKLTEGRVWSHIKGTVLAEYVVETPTIVATVRGTCFDVSYRAAISTVYVSCGSVLVRLIEDASGTGTLLSAGSIISVRDDHAEEDMAAGPRIMLENDKTEWIHFNEDRDEAGGRTVARSSSSHAPPSSTARSITKPRPSSATVVSSQAALSQSTSKSQEAPVVETVLRLRADRMTFDISQTPKLTASTVTGGVDVDVTQKVRWSVHPFAMGTVDRLGGFHPAQAGTVAIDASLDGLQSNRLLLTVTSSDSGNGGTSGGNSPAQITVTSLRVSCIKQGNQTVGGPGSVTAQCAATAIMSDQSTSDVTKGSVWSVQGTVKGFIDQRGYYISGSGQGADTVTASYSGVSGSATITVP